MKKILVVLAVLSLVTFVACDSGKGPMERAGAKVDNAVEATKDKAVEVKDKAVEAVNKAQDAVNAQPTATPGN